MFEQSLLDPAGHPSTRRGWTALLSTFLQATMIAALALLPILRPELLPPPQVETPTVVGRGISTAPVAVSAHRGSATGTVSASALTEPIRAPRTVAPGDRAVEPVVGCGAFGSGAAWAGSGADGFQLPTIGVLPPPSPVAAAPPRTQPLHLSQGVTRGMLVSAPQPVYPEAARIARIQGDVILSAVISPAGEIEQLQVLSGNPFLSAAALDAVRRWKYRPFLLNRTPTAVQTQITVRFVLSRP